jgi:hypothetical protein
MRAAAVTTSMTRANQGRGRSSSGRRPAGRGFRVRARNRIPDGAGDPGSRDVADRQRIGGGVYRGGPGSSDPPAFVISGNLASTADPYLHTPRERKTGSSGAGAKGQERIPSSTSDPLS